MLKEQRMIYQVRNYRPSNFLLFVGTFLKGKNLVIEFPNAQKRKIKTNKNPGEVNTNNVQDVEMKS